MTANCCPDFIKAVFPDALCSGEEYEKWRVIRNSYFHYKPLAILRCKTVEDVQKAVNLCRDNSDKIKGVRVLSGGHHHEGMCSGDGVIIIDVVDINQICSNIEEKYAWIGPGAALQYVYDKLKPYALTLAGGGCGTVRMGGLVQGGGWGLLARFAGLTCDSLLEVEMVTADGQIRRVTQDSDPKNLLWAIKGGGGGNFGVITSYKMKTLCVPDVKVITITYNPKPPSNTAQFVPECHLDNRDQLKQYQEVIIKAIEQYLNHLHTFTDHVTSFARVVPGYIKIGGEYHRYAYFMMSFHCISDEAKKQVQEFFKKLPEFKTTHCQRPVLRTPHKAAEKAVGVKEIKVNEDMQAEMHDFSPIEVLDLLSGVFLSENLKQEEDFDGFDDFNLLPILDILNDESTASQSPTPRGRVSTCGLKPHQGLPHKISSAFPLSDGKSHNDKMASQIVAAILNNHLPSHGTYERWQPRLYLSIHSLGGKVRENPKFKQHSSFAFRDKEYMLQFQAWWGTPSGNGDPNAPKYISWLEEFRKKLKAEKLIEGAFINFPDRDIPTGEYYCTKGEVCENYGKLQSVKGDVDPDNLFKFEMGIPVAKT